MYIYIYIYEVQLLLPYGYYFDHLNESLVTAICVENRLQWNGHCR